MGHINHVFRTLGGLFNSTCTRAKEIAHNYQHSQSVYACDCYVIKHCNCKRKERALAGVSGGIPFLFRSQIVQCCAHIIERP